MNGSPFLTPAQVAAAVVQAFHPDVYEPKGGAVRVENLPLAVTPASIHEVCVAVRHALASEEWLDLSVREVIVRPSDGVVIVAVS